jgi:hypothetical protein
VQGAPAVELVLVGGGANVIAACDGKEEQAPVLRVDAFAEPQRWECASVEEQQPRRVVLLIAAGSCFTAGGSSGHVNEKLLKLRVVLDYLLPRVILPHGSAIAHDAFPF